jgi:hypothetical protein
MINIYSSIYFFGGGGGGNGILGRPSFGAFFGALVDILSFLLRPWRAFASIISSFELC